VVFNEPRKTIRRDGRREGGHDALRFVGDFAAQAVSTHAIDPAAQFPRPPTRGVGAEFPRIGATIRRWFGFGGQARASAARVVQSGASNRSTAANADPT
jgi:hypothetical protein